MGLNLWELKLQLEVSLGAISQVKEAHKNVMQSGIYVAKSTWPVCLARAEVYEVIPTEVISSSRGVSPPQLYWRTINRTLFCMQFYHIWRAMTTENNNAFKLILQYCA